MALCRSSIYRANRREAAARHEKPRQAPCLSGVLWFTEPAMADTANRRINPAPTGRGAAAGGVVGARFIARLAEAPAAEPIARQVGLLRGRGKHPDCRSSIYRANRREAAARHEKTPPGIYLSGVFLVHHQSLRLMIRQPRASATSRRVGSGSTATGWSTFSSSGRSLWESL